jgi:hypothetical protein
VEETQVHNSVKRTGIVWLHTGGTAGSKTGSHS